MKEFPNFDYNGVSYDLNFYDDTVKLYAVKNVYSGMLVSQIIPAANDFIAMQGFANMLSKQKTEGSQEIFQLLCLGTFNHIKIDIVDTEHQIVFDSRNDIAKWMEDAKTFMLSWSDGEEV